MVRNILIVMICGVVVFVFVWKVAPDILATALPFNRTIENVEETAKAEEPVKQHPASKPSPLKANRGNMSVASIAVMPEVAGGSEQHEALESPMAQPVYGAYAHRGPHVSTDNATLYSSNALTGRVVRVLKKDEVLELHFKVNNGGQEWMYVNVPSQQVSGFLSSDTLAE